MSAESINVLLPYLAWGSIVFAASQAELDCVHDPGEACLCEIGGVILAWESTQLPSPAWTSGTGLLSTLPQGTWSLPAVDTSPLLIGAAASSSHLFDFGPRILIVGAVFATLACLGLWFGQRPPEGTDAPGRWKGIQFIAAVSPLAVIAGGIIMRIAFA